MKRTFTEDTWENFEKEWAEHLNKITVGLLKLEYIGVDGWDRPIFQDKRFPGWFFGDATNLFESGASRSVVNNYYKTFPERIRDITYFGERFGCEPWGLPISKIKIEIA
jgi:hypothetical protein